jgi:hypothetical protein
MRPTHTELVTYRKLQKRKNKIRLEKEKKRVWQNLREFVFVFMKGKLIALFQVKPRSQTLHFIATFITPVIILPVCNAKAGKAIR